METLFLEFLKISAICSIGILLIFAVSPLLRKRHTVYWRYCLWTLLAVRLILPFDCSLPGQAVVIPLPVRMPEKRTVSEAMPDGWENGALPAESDLEENRPAAQRTEAGSDKIKNRRAEAGGVENKEGGAGERYSENDTTAQNEVKYDGLENRNTKRHKISVFRCAAVIWAAAVVMLLIGQAGCYAVFSSKVKRTKVYFCDKKGLPVYVSPAVSSPMLTGIRRPQIVLPVRDYEEEPLIFILEHEFTHYRRKDLWIKLLLAFARTLHWFNPLVLWMERQAARDMELLCDGDVVRHFSREEKRQYGETLLSCAASGSRRTVLYTSEFSRDVKTLKERFANLFSAEGKTKGILAVVLGMCLLGSVSLFVVFGASAQDISDVPAGQEISASEERRADRKTTEETAKKSADQEGRQKKVPSLKELSKEEAANAAYGAVFPRLAYASEERAVLYDDRGLLIYDLENRRIEQLLDLKAADFNHMQGDLVTHIEVSADGKQILLYNEPDTRERYVYDIDDKRLTYSDLDSFGERRYDGLYEQGEWICAVTDTKKAVCLSSESLRDENGNSYHETDMQGLSLVVSGADWGNSEIYPLFEEYYEKQGEKVISRLGTEDFGRIVGKEFLYADEDGWTYYLEEDRERESALWEIAEVWEPLLLTRYREGDRQVLEDLISQETWRECPVLFAGGRILYQAARTADIVGVKEAALVSIAMDGSDRKTADTVLYDVFDGICEDHGWIYYSGWTNDAQLPKPLCRISPDFSSGAQLVEEIPGYLCGVMDGSVYYLAGKEKNAGIWKRNLETGEEQIYDKWGMAAEDFRLFLVRERQYAAGELRDEAVSGCRILYSPDYDGEICVYNLPFDAEN